ncbi:adenylate cyclase [Rhodospirillales bacterium URHD0017]|nr:adenylate cyclase [Rhodospirillales bacterium URHD0017]
MTEQRRLAAILVADVVGYSKLMGGDEAGTLARLEALRREIIELQIAKHAGRLFKSVGDGFLIEFASAVQAVSCAKAIQEATRQDRLTLRIGIHVGDVVVQGDDLMGDGVNVAARVEGIADPGGIAITRAVHEQVRDKLDLGFIDKGEIELKNIQRPVQVFVIGGVKVDSQVAALPLPDKPSIAVLPFQNMSGDPEQEYFVDGLVEEIITALSRFTSLFVIARNSSFSFRGRAVDIKEVGRTLGVRYVLEGSVRKAGGRVRITGQLLEAETGVHLWADRFDGAQEDVFELQDAITEKVVVALAPRVERAEIDRSRKKASTNLSAHDFYLRGLSAYQLITRESINDAVGLFRQALAHDPLHSSAIGMLLASLGSRRGVGLVGAVYKENLPEIAELVRTAVRVGHDDAQALAHTAYAAALILRDLPAATGYVERALELNPNLAAAWTNSGWINLWACEPARSVEHLHRAIRHDPLALTVRAVAIAHAYFFLDSYDDALRWAETALRETPEMHAALRISAASAAFAKQTDLARDFRERLQAIHPEFRVSSLESVLGPYRLSEYVEKYREGLRLAGLPE